MTYPSSWPRNTQAATHDKTQRRPLLQRMLHSCSQPGASLKDRLRNPVVGGSLRGHDGVSGYDGTQCWTRDTSHGIPPTLHLCHPVRVALKAPLQHDAATPFRGGALQTREPCTSNAAKDAALCTNNFCPSSLTYRSSWPRGSGHPRQVLAGTDARESDRHLQRSVIPSQGPPVDVCRGWPPPRP